MTSMILAVTVSNSFSCQKPIVVLEGSGEIWEKQKLVEIEFMEIRPQPLAQRPFA